MIYPKKIVRLPEGMKVGSEILISGEGTEIFTITAISYDTDGDVIEIHNSSEWREPMSKIYLYTGDFELHAENRAYVATGECDKCGRIFSDSFAYGTTEEYPMLCSTCCKEIKRNDSHNSQDNIFFTL